MGGMSKQFDKAVSHTRELRRELDQWLEEWGRRADENPEEVAATFARSALYWRRVWRRRYHRLAARAKRRVVAENEYVRLVANELREPRENGRLMYALWEYTLWDSTFWMILEPQPWPKL